MEFCSEFFSCRLFTVNPELTELFTFGKEFNDNLDPEGRAFQGMKLMNMIGTAVRGLNDPETIIPTVKKLGARHKRYGVKEHHFEVSRFLHFPEMANGP